MKQFFTKSRIRRSEYPIPIMPSFKTKYPRIYFIERGLHGSSRKECNYYIIYRKHGKIVEEKVGRQTRYAMTPATAAKIRADRIIDKRLSGREFQKERKTKEKSTPDKFVKESHDRNLLEEKWLVFMESSTDGFALLDSKLRMVEMNDAALKLFPAGTRKDDVLGKTLEEFAPGAKKRGEVESFLCVLKTGEPFVMNEIVSPPRFGERYLNYKVFKVGDELGMIITDMTELIQKEQELRKSENDLKELNTALEVLLKKREKDNAERDERIIFNVKTLIEPNLEKLRESCFDDTQKNYLDVLESNLREIISPLELTLSKQYQKLTPLEVQVANHIRLGKSSKEIARMFHLSPRTVETHRMRIRDKLGIKNKKINLQIYLASLGNTLKSE